ncbi:sulfatase [Amycolatopsis sp. NPDC059027]|uniref:sulfatase family protein n=1 Tax=unclassified Amycolatopsis TaxID=2618356 RepID=UPI0036732B67
MWRKGIFSASRQSAKSLDRERPVADLQQTFSHFRIATAGMPPYRTGMSSQRKHGPIRRGVLVALAGAACLLVTSCAAAQVPAASTQPGAADRPNVVFVLTDDLAMNLVQYMPNVQKLARDGTTFANYTVTDSLCCPSRSSIFTGKFPHDTGVVTNGGSDGGFDVFHKRGNEKATSAVALQAAGYRTGMMGKYLNGYNPRGKVDGQENYVPPGWDEWDVAGNGYPEFDYDLNENHTVKHYGSQPEDYLTDVVSGKASGFINSSVSAHKPFLLEVATFAPHGPFTPAPRDQDAFPGLTAPRGKAFDQLPSNPPQWLAGRTPLTDKEKSVIDTGFRKRAQAVQAVDRMVGSLRDTLTKAGVADDTLVVFSSDNGFHMGEYRLNPGKMTAFDTDIHVPLIVAGGAKLGVGANKTISNPVENIDLAPTFEKLAGLTPAADVDGHDLMPLLTGQPVPDGRTTALIEHHGPDFDASDPDKPGKNSGNPATYEALRTVDYTYVEYTTDGSAEFYDRTADPDELNNAAGSLPPDRRAQLHNALQALANCHGQQACSAAERLLR